MKSLIAVIVLSWLAGAFPTSYIAGKLLKGIDIRSYGSGNAGATNTARVLGKKAGASVLAVDFLKGLLCVALIGRLDLFGDSFSNIHIQYLAAFAASVAGHIFPVYIGFKGGKGAAPAAGGVSALVPLAFPLCLAVFIAVFLKTRIISASSLSAVWSLSIFYIPVSVIFGNEIIFPYEIFFILAALLITWKHRDNISRLFKGEEKKFSLNSEDKI